MSPSELEQYLHQHIPLTQAMQLRVATADARHVVLTAPLEPNINHRSTAFGGSIAAVATLAAWSLVHVRLRAEGLESRLVIHRNSMEYRRPISGPFAARASITDEATWAQFVKTFRRRGKARINVTARVAQLPAGTNGWDEPMEKIAGTFVGDFVALGVDAKSGTLK